MADVAGLWAITGHSGVYGLLTGLFTRGLEQGRQEDYLVAKEGERKESEHSRQ